MKKEMTELVFILDKSGSMSGLESDTIGGYNSMLSKQKDLEGDCRITTVLFDNTLEVLHDRIDIQAVSPLTKDDYFVGGMTALMDALGATILKIKNVQNRTAEEYRAEKVIFVIITDGMENASREYSSQKIKSLIEEQKERYNWEFIFLAANIDAVETASHYGIPMNRAVNYVPDKHGTNLNFMAMSNAVKNFRKNGSVSDIDLECIRDDYKRRGEKPKPSKA